MLRRQLFFYSVLTLLFGLVKDSHHTSTTVTSNAGSVQVSTSSSTGSSVTSLNSISSAGDDQYLSTNENVIDDQDDDNMSNSNGNVVIDESLPGGQEEIISGSPTNTVVQITNGGGEVNGDSESKSCDSSFKCMVKAAVKYFSF